MKADCWCNGCKTWKFPKDFTRRSDRPIGRESRCTMCRNAAYRAYKQGRDEQPKAIEWRYPVPSTNPRFGVAMIGGGYV